MVPPLEYKTLLLALMEPTSTANHRPKSSLHNINAAPPPRPRRYRIDDRIIRTTASRTPQNGPVLMFRRLRASVFMSIMGIAFMVCESWGCAASMKAGEHRGWVNGRYRLKDRTLYSSKPHKCKCTLARSIQMNEKRERETKWFNRDLNPGQPHDARWQMNIACTYNIERRWALLWY
jgi:hypothetical protein